MVRWGCCTRAENQGRHIHSEGPFLLVIEWYLTFSISKGQLPAYFASNTTSTRSVHPCSQHRHSNSALQGTSVDLPIGSAHQQKQHTCKAPWMYSSCPQFYHVEGISAMMLQFFSSEGAMFLKFTSRRPAQRQQEGPPVLGKDKLTPKR